MVMKMADKCIDSIIQAEARDFSSSYDYVAQLLFPEYSERFGATDPAELARDLQEKRLSDIQLTLNADLKEMIDSGFLELEEVLIIVEPSVFIPEAFLFAGSDESLIYEWEMPGYITSALEEGETYIWKEQGVPELGLEGEYLITIGRVESPFSAGLFFAYVGLKPMNEEVAAITSFFDDEVSTANLMLASVLGISIILILLVTFFLLNFLIKRRITEPIEELSADIEEVMQGDLDVEIDVHEGGEFEGLQLAFKKMVDSFRAYIARSVGEKPGEGNSKEAAPVKTRRKPSRILYEITVLVVVVMVVTGLAVFFVIRHSQGRIIENSIEFMLETEAENFFSSLNYTIQLNIDTYMEQFEDTVIQELINSLSAKEISSLQESVISDMQDLVAIGYHGMEKVMLVVPPASLNPNTVVWASNERELIYEWELPQSFMDAIEDDIPYVLFEEGIPELGINSKYLVTFNELENPLIPTMPFYYIAIKPMTAEIASICTFCNQERNRANLLLASILAGSIALVILITFFFLNHLIKKQIIQPVEELSAAAEKVMQGDLDVQVGIHEGEELEILKRAFNEMVESLRKFIARSVGEE
jgi:methyl-accepting chemotaxis protein